MRIQVTEDDAGRRLDALVRRAAGLPRPLVMQLIRKGRVRRNGERAALDARVETGDVVEVEAREPAPSAIRPPIASGIEHITFRHPALPPLEIVRRILFEDEDLLVFDKPSGIVAHAGSGHAGGLVDVLSAFLASRSGRPGEASPEPQNRSGRPPGTRPASQVEEGATASRGPFRPALAQRLDRDTSGATIVAKTGLGLRGLTAAIRAGRLEKTYLALVRGAPIPAEGVIEAALRKDAAEDGRERMRVVAPDAPGALSARTRYRTLRALAGGRAALLELTPDTGRTHQLRVHCAHLGHPIAGDPRYGDRAFDAALRDKAGLARLFLHAARVAFPHPRTSERVEVVAPMAGELETVLARLK